MMTSRDEGQRRFDAAVESGERLFMSTSTDGREVIRHDLRQLRDKWEAFKDSLAEVREARQSLSLSLTSARLSLCLSLTSARLSLCLSLTSARLSLNASHLSRS